MYFHTDLNGCPEELTDENGKILWECSFQLWGKRIHEIEHEPIEQNLRYQGQYLDRETGLHYNTFRYYDPDIGRFTQPDPIGLLGGLNLYQYAPNGLTWIDPWGWSYSTWQIHSPGYNDIVQKGLHFYAPGGVELSVRPDHKGGITFTNAIPNERGSVKVTKAIMLAKERFENDMKFRNDILNKANEGV
jgi:RHS repeat-associated protein